MRREREDSLGRVQPRHGGSEWEKALCNCNPDKYPEPRRTTDEQREEERQRKRGSKREKERADRREREGKRVVVMMVVVLLLLLPLLVAMVLEEVGDGEQKGAGGREREKERLRVAEKLFGLLRNETKRNASPVPIYMRQSINRACVAPTQSYPLVVRRRLRGLPARISPLGVPASAQGCGLKILKIPRPFRVRSSVRSFVCSSIHPSVCLGLVCKRTPRFQRSFFPLVTRSLAYPAHPAERIFNLASLSLIPVPFSFPLSLSFSLHPPATYPPYRKRSRFLKLNRSYRRATAFPGSPGDTLGDS